MMTLSQNEGSISLYTRPFLGEGYIYRTIDVHLFHIKWNFSLTPAWWSPFFCFFFLSPIFASSHSIFTRRVIFACLLNCNFANFELNIKRVCLAYGENLKNRSTVSSDDFCSISVTISLCHNAISAPVQQSKWNWRLSFECFQPIIKYSNRKKKFRATINKREAYFFFYKRNKKQVDWISFPFSIHKIYPSSHHLPTQFFLIKTYNFL